MMNIRFFLVGVAIIGLLIGPQSAGAAVDLSVSIGDRKIIVFEDDVSEEAKQAVLKEAGVVTIESLDSIDVKVVVSNKVNDETLEARPEIKRVDDDVRIYALSHRTRSAPPQIIPWGVERIGAPTVWSRATGSPIQVAVIDTGIDLDHPDLARNLRAGFNAISPSRSVDDDNGHGTHVAGTIGAVNNGIGTVGVAIDAALTPVKVLDRRGRGYLSDIVEGIDWAIEHDADVINLSLGTDFDIPSLHEAIDRALRANVVVVAAAGNSGGEVLYPARYDGVIAVGATDDTNEVQHWSSRGTALDLVAPGEDIYSTYKEGKYTEATGTSMAAPHVSGVAALLLDKPEYCDTDGDHRCGPAEVQRRIEATATDLLGAGRDDVSGAGLVNAARALGL